MSFDSNVLILYLGNLLDEESLEFKILTKSLAEIRAYISIVVLMEVLAYSGYTRERAEDIRLEIMNSFNVIEMNNDIAMLAANIARERKQKTGKKLKLTDAIIAATAICNDFPLITLDKDDFNGIEKLKCK